MSEYEALSSLSVEHSPFELRGLPANSFFSRSSPIKWKASDDSSHEIAFFEDELEGGFS